MSPLSQEDVDPVRGGEPQKGPQVIRHKPLTQSKESEDKDDLCISLLTHLVPLEPLEFKNKSINNNYIVKYINNFKVDTIKVTEL